MERRSHQASKGSPSAFSGHSDPTLRRAAGHSNMVRAAVIPLTIALADKLIERRPLNAKRRPIRAGGDTLDSGLGGPTGFEKLLEPGAIAFVLFDVDEGHEEVGAQWETHGGGVRASSGSLDAGPGYWRSSALAWSRPKSCRSWMTSASTITVGAARRIGKAVESRRAPWRTHGADAKASAGSLDAGPAAGAPRQARGADAFAPAGSLDADASAASVKLSR